jgi:hypothetical protein
LIVWAVLAPVVCLVLLVIEKALKPSKFSALLFLIGFHVLIEISTRFRPEDPNLLLLITLIGVETLLFIHVFNRILGQQRRFWYPLTLLLFAGYAGFSFVSTNKLSMSDPVNFLDSLLIRGLIVKVYFVHYFFTGIGKLRSSRELKDVLITVAAFLLFYIGIFYFLLFGRMSTTDQLLIVFELVYDPLFYLFYATLSIGTLWRLVRS